jgi:hypothetical protein
MADTNSAPLAIAELIESRRRELGLKRVQLVRRAGLKNETKALRRLGALLAGDLRASNSLIDGLPAALNLPPEAIQCALEETGRQIEEAEARAREEAEAAWRAAFKPHAIIVVERTVPEPIFVAAAMGLDRILRVDFNYSGGEGSWARRALEGVREKLAEFGGVLPAFGHATGFIVNYSPDFAVRFSLDGTPQEVFGAAYRIGEASLLLKGGKPIPREMLPPVTKFIWPGEAEE